MNRLNYHILEAYYLAALHGYIPNEDPTTQSDISEFTHSTASSEESIRGAGLVAAIFTALLILSVFSIYVVQQKFANSTSTQVNGVTQQRLQR